MAAMLVFDMRWLMGVFHYRICLLLTIMVDTKTKSLDSLIGTEDIRDCVISHN